MVFLGAAQRPDYAGAADLVARLPAELAAAQKRLGLTPKVLASQVGVTTATATRLLGGGTPTLPTILAALRWLAAH